MANFFVENEIFTQNANKFLTEASSVFNYSLSNKKIIPEKKQIVLTLVNGYRIDSIKQILERKKVIYDLENAIYVVKRNVNSENKIDMSLIQDLFSKQENLLKTKNNGIAILKNTFIKSDDFKLKRNETIKEFHTPFGAPNELIIERGYRFF